MPKRSILLSIILTAAVAAGGCGEAKTELLPDDEPPISTRDSAPMPVKKTSASSAAASKAQTETDKAETDTDSDSNAEADTEKDNGAEPVSIDVGGLTLSSNEIMFENAVTLSDKDNADAAVYGSSLYLLDGKKLRRFELGDTAEETDTISLSGKYSKIDTDPYGIVYLSRERFDCAALGEDGELSPIDTTGELSLSKVMEFGLCKSGGKITKCSVESAGEWSSVAERELSFPDNVSSVEFAGNHVLIARREDGVSSLAVCDYDGNTLSEAADSAVGDDITAMTETAGVIAASSCGDLCLWNDSGEYIGRLSSDETAQLFGSPSPVMIKRLFEGGSGEMLAFCADDKTNEAHLYRITGM